MVAALCLAGGCAAAPLPAGGSLREPRGGLVDRGEPRRRGVGVGRTVRPVGPGRGLGLRGDRVCRSGVVCGPLRSLHRADDLAWRLGDSPVPVAIEATVVESFRLVPAMGDDPRRTAAIGPSSECVVRVESFRVGSRWRPASGRAAVIVDGEPPALVVGSRVRVLGRGLRPAPAFNPGEFDFRLRARAYRCLSIVRVPSARCVRVVSSTAGYGTIPAADRPPAVPGR